MLSDHKSIHEMRSAWDALASSYDCLSVREWGGSLAAGQLASGQAISAWGATLSGSELYSVEIESSRNDSADKPTLVVVSGVHARELASRELALKFGEYLCTQWEASGADSHLVDYGKIVFVPEANPDGVELYFAGNGAWSVRKAPVADMGQYPPPVGLKDDHGGDDLNRNQAYAWGTNDGWDSGSPDPGSWTHRGSAALSHPHSQWLKSVLEEAIAGSSYTCLVDIHGPYDFVCHPYGDVAGSFDGRSSGLSAAMAEAAGLSRGSEFEMLPAAATGTIVDSYAGPKCSSVLYETGAPVDVQPGAQYMETLFLTSSRPALLSAARMSWQEAPFMPYDMSVALSAPGAVFSGSAPGASEVQFSVCGPPPYAPFRSEPVSPGTFTFSTPLPMEFLVGSKGASGCYARAVGPGGEHGLLHRFDVYEEPFPVAVYEFTGPQMFGASPALEFVEVMEQALIDMDFGNSTICGWARSEAGADGTFFSRRRGPVSVVQVYNFNGRMFVRGNSGAYDMGPAISGQWTFFAISIAENIAVPFFKSPGVSLSQGTYPSSQNTLYAPQQSVGNSLLGARWFGSGSTAKAFKLTGEVMDLRVYDQPLDIEQLSAISAEHEPS